MPPGDKLMNTLTDTKLVATIHKISLLLGMLVFLAGLLTLFLWVISQLMIPPFSLLPGSINPIFALAFILTGLSLLLQAYPIGKTHVALSLTGKLCGVIILLLGIIPLIDYAWGYHFYLGELIHTSQLTTSSNHALIQMMPGIFISITFAGLALILLDLQYTAWIVQIMSLLIGIDGLSILSVTGSEFQITSVVMIYPLSTIFIAFVLTAVSISLFCSRPEKGIMVIFASATTGGNVARWLVPFVLLIPIIVGNLWMIDRGGNLYAYTSIMSHSFSVIAALFLVIILAVSHSIMKTDIRQKQISLQLQQSHNEIEYLYNHAPCGYHSLDKHGVFIRVNNTELEWLGYQRNELIGKLKFHDLLTPECRQNLLACFNHSEKWANLKNQELQLQNRNGAELIILYNSFATRNTDGSLLVSHAAIFDITEKREIEKTSKISKDQFRSAMDIAPIGMAIVGLDGRFIEVNHSFCHIVGYEKNELEKKSFQEITHPKDLSTDLVHLKQLMDGKIQSYHLDKRHVRKDGRLIWVQITVSLQRDSISHEPLFFITQVEDITERKQMEIKIRHLVYEDPLTHLPNRRMLIDRLNQAIARADRHQHILAVLFLDLDKFKHINDTLGHDAGDELLKAVAVRLSSTLRMDDTMARLSGDEFVIILNELHDGKEASVVAQKLLTSMTRPFLVMGHEIQSNISIGIAIFPRDGRNSIELIKHADTAMYSSKEAGTNLFRYYQSQNFTR